MSSLLAMIIATLVTIPALGYLIVFAVSKQITKSHRRSVHIALDSSTLLFIIAVHFLIVTIWNKSFLWVILLSLLVIAAAFVLIHWKTKQEIILPKVFRGFWRFNFLFFLSAYLLLLLFGVIQRVFAILFM